MAKIEIHRENGFLTIDLAEKNIIVDGEWLIEDCYGEAFSQWRSEWGEFPMEWTSGTPGDNGNSFTAATSFVAAR